MTCEHLGQPQVLDALRRLGLTERRLWYWTAAGLVAVHHHVDGRRVDDRAGSGVPLFYDVADLPVLQIALVLISGGMQLGPAFALARTPGLQVRLDDGGRLRYHPPA